MTNKIRQGGAFVDVDAGGGGGGGFDFLISGKYHWDLWTSGSAANTQANTTGQMYLRPISIPASKTFDRIGIQVTTAATAGGVIRLGIYTWAQVLLLDAGTIASTTTGAKEITISQTLAAGNYWLAIAPEVAACTTQACPNASLRPDLQLETTPVSGPASNMGPSCSGYVAGSLPGNAVQTGRVPNYPLVGLRVA